MNGEAATFAVGPDQYVRERPPAPSSEPTMAGDFRMGNSGG
jgi:hypothetical protein